MRGQSTVVGVALLLAVTVVALGTMAATVGTVVEDAATDADVRRVTADFDRAFRPVETTGTRRAGVRFSAGRLETLDRTVRVLNEAGVVSRIDGDGVRYVTPSGDRAVTFVAGAILVTDRDYTRVVRPPPVAAGPGVLVVGVPAVNGTVGVGGTRLTLDVATAVTHDRRSLGAGEYRVAVETTTPGAWNRTLAARGATGVTTRDLDGDGVPSVVAAFAGSRDAHVVVHDLRVVVE